MGEDIVKTYIFVKNVWNSLMDEQVSETQKWVKKYVDLPLNEDWNSPILHMDEEMSETYFQMKKCFKNLIWKNKGLEFTYYCMSKLVE